MTGKGDLAAGREDACGVPDTVDHRGPWERGLGGVELLCDRQALLGAELVGCVYDGELVAREGAIT